MEDIQADNLNEYTDDPARTIQNGHIATDESHTPSVPSEPNETTALQPQNINNTQKNSTGPDLGWHVKYEMEKS